MKTSTTIAAFHIGRGGPFHNAGHRSFIGFNPISHYTADLFLNHENIHDFKDRFGFDTTHSSDVKCILDLASDEDYDTLEELYGITEEMLGTLQYYDGGGNPVELTKEEADSGIGRINIDHAYNTTYTCYLHDCDEQESKMILEDSTTFAYLSDDDTAILNEIAGVEIEEEDEA